jgi:hypothetical protein
MIPSLCTLVNVAGVDSCFAIYSEYRIVIPIVIEM